MLDKEKFIERKKILLVDDVGLFLQLEETFFKRKNCIIYTAKSGSEALNIVKEKMPDLIVLDFYMPDMNGDEVCKVIKFDERLKHIPIIMVSKSSKTEDIEKCLKAGADHYITKPIKQRELLEKAVELLNIPVRRDMRILVKLEVEGKSGVQTFLGKTENISSSGMFIVIDSELEVNSAVILKFLLPGSKDEITVMGTIVRCEPDKNIGYGIVFRDIPLNVQQKLDEFIKESN